jgi:hypothetical protein
MRPLQHHRKPSAPARSDAPSAWHDDKKCLRMTGLQRWQGPVLLMPDNLAPPQFPYSFVLSHIAATRKRGRKATDKCRYAKLSLLDKMMGASSCPRQSTPVTLRLHRFRQYATLSWKACHKLTPKRATRRRPWQQINGKWICCVAYCCRHTPRHPFRALSVLDILPALKDGDSYGAA